VLPKGVTREKRRENYDSKKCDAFKFPQVSAGYSCRLVAACHNNALPGKITARAMLNSDHDQVTLIAKAVQALQQGALVAFPTETVYGLGADASSPAALERLYQAKGRPANHPVIVHVSDVEQLADWAAHIPPDARILADAFWPGPLTLILPRAPHVLAQITGGQGTVGLRIPNHPLALKLLSVFQGGLAAPSANRFGRLSPTTAQDVVDDFGDEVAMVLDGGPCEVGIESTIVDASGEGLRILRPGMILPDHIEDVLGKPLHRAGDKPGVRFSGGLPSHYAPNTKVILVAPEKLVQTVTAESAGGKQVAVLAVVGIAGGGSSWIAQLGSEKVIVAPADPAAYARQLYRSMRTLDKLQLDVIVVEQVPPGGAWSGIADRLARAAAEQIQMRGETA
jgi:L-threonylcarbamoyladenylate synthase